MLTTLKLNVKVFLTFAVIFATAAAVPQLQNSSDGREYLIETELKVSLLRKKLKTKTFKN